jgi:hypothetical protein
VLEFFLELLFEVRVQCLVHDVVLCQKDKVKVSEQGPMLIMMPNFFTLHMRFLAQLSLLETLNVLFFEVEILLDHGDLAIDGKNVFEHKALPFDKLLNFLCFQVDGSEVVQIFDADGFELVELEVLFFLAFQYKFISLWQIEGVNVEFDHDGDNLFEENFGVGFLLVTFLAREQLFFQDVQENVHFGDERN